MQRTAPFRTLDALRGFAALWVVMAHSCDRFLGSNLQYLDNPLYEFSIRGQLGVLVFFVISGYCIAAAAQGALYSGKTLGRYAFERFRRIFPPYWVALALGLIAHLVIQLAASRHWISRPHHLDAIPASPAYWIANLTLTQSEFGTQFENVVFWSLCYEILFYVIIGVFLFLAKRVSANGNLAAGQLTLILGPALLTLASLLILTIFATRIFPFDLWHLFGLGSMLFSFLECNANTVAGYSTRLRLLISGLSGAAVILCLVYAVTRRLGLVGLANLGHFSSDTFAIGCVIVCVSLVLIRRFDTQLERSILLRPLFWLGACSYSLYLIHPVVLPFIDVTARKLGLDGSRYWIAFLIQVAGAVVVGRVFYHFVERNFVSPKQVKRLREEHVA